MNKLYAIFMSNEKLNTWTLRSGLFLNLEKVEKELYNNFVILNTIHGLTPTLKIFYTEDIYKKPCIFKSVVDKEIISLEVFDNDK